MSESEAARSQRMDQARRWGHELRNRDRPVRPRLLSCMGRLRVSAPARQRLPSLIWLQGLLCGALVTLAPGMAVLLASFLAPAIAAAVLDRQPGKPRARAAFLLSGAACVSPIRSLWSGSGDLAAALSIALDPSTLLRTWIAAGVGWSLAELGPVALRAAVTFADRIRRRRLEALRDRLREEWGGSV